MESKTRKKGKKKLYLIVGAAVLLIAAGVFFYEYLSRELQIKRAADANRDLRDEVVDQQQMAENQNKYDISDYLNDSEGETDGGQAAEDEPYVSPIDFEKLWKKNEDAIGWVTIPDTDMSFPVMYHPGDNTYYLYKNFNREKSIYGAAYIEDYNNSDFSDNATVIYGHDISNGEWFGELQTIFTDPDRFEKSRNIKLYLPDEERTYRVFAAVPYGSEHILYYNDFSKARDYNMFINNITSVRPVNSKIDKSELPEYDTPLLIFSTCLKGDYSHRFLVLAYRSR